MYIILILFFGSLLGITFMIGRKLVLLKRGRASMTEEIMLDIPYLTKWKDEIVKNIKKYGHTSLVATLRFYVRLNNFSKNRYQKLKSKLKNTDKNQNQQNDGTVEKIESSKFLKMISEYKHKIREIKHKIHEEEKNS